MFPSIHSIVILAPNRKPRMKFSRAVMLSTFILRLNELDKDRLPVLVKPLRELALESGDTIHRPLQLRIGHYLLRAGCDIAVV